MTTTPCPSCRAGSKPTGKYLCGTCWFTLTGPARRALSRSDAKALARLRQLHEQLDRGVPLTEIQVTP